MRKLSVFAGMLMAATVVARAEVIYVDADAPPGGNGQSWLAAYDNLQDALRSARPGDDIWIAEGTYYPTSKRNRSKSFELPDGVALYGGFAGVEERREQRNWEEHETILSGNIGDPESALDNSYRILIAENLGPDTLVDGLTITEAHNERITSPDGRAGGILLEQSNLAIANCRVVDNFAVGGGGLWNDGGSPTIDNTVFDSNERNAISSPFGGDLTITRCTFMGSRSSRGAAIYMHFTPHNSVIRDCVFRRNRASGRGGAYYGAGDPRFENCLFYKNHARSFGGGVYVFSGDPTIVNCTFVANSTDNQGGGLCIGSDRSSVRVTNAVFWGNTARLGDKENQQIGWRSPIINYSCVEGWTGKHGGVGNHGEDPLFLDPDKGNLRLRAGSPCIDKGDNEAVTEPKDLDGNPRILHETVDMGVYESVCDDLSGLELTCSDTGKLKAKLTTSLPKGSTVTLVSSAGKAKPAGINKRGKGTAKWRNQTGQIEICPAACDGPCQRVECP